MARIAAPEILPRLPAGKQRFRLRVYAALLMLDSVAIVASFIIANFVRLGEPFAPVGPNLAVVMLPFYLALAANRSIYCQDFFKDWRQNARRACSALILAALAVLFLSFYLQASARLSRLVFTTGCAIAVVAVVVVRFALHRYVTGRRRGDVLTKVLIRDEVAGPNEPDVIVFNAHTLGLEPDRADPAARDRLGWIVHGADRVIVACPASRRGVWAEYLKGCGIQGEILMPELAALGTLGATDYAGNPTLIVSTGPLNIHDRLVKRAIDLAFAGSALAFLAPLMLITALAVKLESRGPVLFVQPRLGRGNRLFSMYKFRSMRADDCDPSGQRSTERGDKRVTRVGRLIRATSIDELPQLLNVLKGEMSIVGPRPHALGSLAGDKLFWEVDGRYWNRHVAKPGITGLAQVRGFRGATHQQSDLVERLQADLEYVTGWTVWRDVRILCATLGVVLHRNAY